MKKLPLEKRLIKVRWPCTADTAREDLGQSLVATLIDLAHCTNKGLLFKVGTHYAPTPKLIQYWDDEGMLEALK